MNRTPPPVVVSACDAAASVPPCPHMDVLNHITESFLIVDFDWRLRFANNHAVAYFASPPDDVIGRSLWELAPDAVGTRFERECRAAVEENRLIEYEDYHSPREQWFDIRIFPTRDGLAILGRDITERKVAARDRAETEDRFRGIVEQSLAGIYVVDGEKFSYVNARFAEIFGYTAEEITARITISDLVADVDRARALENIRRRLSGAVDSVHYRFQGVRKDGARLQIEVHGRRSEIGGRSIIVGVLLDVTDTAAAEAALRDQEEQYRTVTDGLPILIGFVDAGERYVFANRSYEGVFGMQRSEIVGKRVAELLGEATYAIARPRIRAALMGATVEYELALTCGKDGYCRAQISYVPRRSAAGEVIGYFEFAVDVTERHELQLQLQQSQKMEAVGQLAGGVAHDFNNLLTVITGFSTLLGTSVPPGTEGWGHLQEIRKAADRSADLTRQLLAFSRRQIMTPQILDPNETVRGFEGILRRLIGEDVALVTHLDPRVGRVEADAGQLEQVLLNLAANARDAMPTGGTLTLSTRSVAARASVRRGLSECVRISIADTGSGMDEATRQRIFEPFFTSKEVGRGTGLGLSTVYGIVKQSGGHIEVDTAPGQGATFHVYLPCAAEPAAAAPEAEAAVVERTQSTGHIMVVEDDPAVRSLTVKVLTRAGYRVTAATNGPEAIRLCRESDDLDLILTDVVMPEMSGRELAGHIHAEWPGLPIVFTSGYTDDAVLRHGVRQTDCHFVQKPWQPAVLLDRIRDVMGG